MLYSSAIEGHGLLFVQTKSHELTNTQAETTDDGVASLR